VVKAPLIVHQVDKKDPGCVTQHNVVEAYHDWLVVALERWKEHTRIYKGVGQKPVLFIMTEKAVYADRIGGHIRKQARLKFYYPDFVAVQRAQNGMVNWIIETKGREYEDVEHKLFQSSHRPPVIVALATVVADQKLDRH